MRLIDADAAIKKLQKYVTEMESDIYYGSNLGIPKDCICEAIEEVPTIEAEPVVHAHWIMEKDYEDGKADYKCSNCEFDDTFFKDIPERFYKRCPHCGAKMDKEAKQE